MNKPRTLCKRWKPVLIAWLCLAIAIYGAAGLAAEAPELAIVVHPEVPVDNVSLTDLRRIFLAEQQFWSSNLRVTLLIRAPVAREREVVLKTIYEMSEAQYRQYWIAKVFRAEVTGGPKIVYSNEMASELAFGIPGSIAFVEGSRVLKGLKVLKVNGHLPGQKGYPLR